MEDNDCVRCCCSPCACMLAYSMPYTYTHHTNKQPQDSQKSANLKRIRDNQRRSRQRRKEYLQELETKVRDFEHQQVQATVEMQSAARRVNDQNKLLQLRNKRLKAENAGLREVLSDYGVADTEVERRLAVIMGHPQQLTNRFSSPSFSEGGASQLEDAMPVESRQAPATIALQQQQSTTHPIRVMNLPVTIPPITTLPSNGVVRAPILPVASYDMAPVSMTYPVMTQSGPTHMQHPVSWPYSYA